MESHGWPGRIWILSRFGHSTFSIFRAITEVLKFISIQPEKLVNKRVRWSTILRKIERYFLRLWQSTAQPRNIQWDRGNSPSTSLREQKPRTKHTPEKHAAYHCRRHFDVKWRIILWKSQRRSFNVMHYQHLNDLRKFSFELL